MVRLYLDPLEPALVLSVNEKSGIQALDRSSPVLPMSSGMPERRTPLTPAIKTWLEAHPRFHMHLTPTSSSWLNQVERWFGLLTDKKLRRGVHNSVPR